MSIDNAYIAALSTFTDDELLKLYRWAMVNGAGGTSRTINGRSITFPSTTDLMAAINWLEGRVNAAADAAAGGGGIALVQFGEEV